MRYNGEWFSKFAFLDVMGLTSKITIQRMLERDNFANRLKKGTPIYLHECLYPLMQGYDSVVIKADVELGGSEQLFNLNVGRDLQRDAEQEPQVCLTLPILVGTDGTRRMGKSLGNYVGVGEAAYDQFAKTMSIPDDVMKPWFELLTDRSSEEIARLTDVNATHPRQAKEVLGKDIACFYYGEQAANDAAAEWRKRFSERQDPTDIAAAPLARSNLTDGKMVITKLLVALGLAKSNNEARRLVEGGGVNIGPNREKITDLNQQIAVTDGLIVRVGSKRVVRVHPT